MYHCLFRQADTDNNGVIDKEEFRQLWGAVRCSGGGEVSVSNKIDLDMSLSVLNINNL